MMLRLLVLWLVACALLVRLDGAEERGGGEEETETFERVQARSLLPVHQLMVDELGHLLRTARKSGDGQQRFALDAALAIAEQRQKVLAAGRIPHLTAEVVRKEEFLRTATGRQWSLIGTQNVKRIGVLGGTLRYFSEDGLTELGTVASDHLAPGVFGGRRREGGWSLYLVAPDLQRVLVLIVPKTYVGTQVNRGEKPEPVTVTAGGAVPEATTDGSLLTLLEGKFRQKLLQAEEGLIVLIEAELRESGSSASAEKVAALRARLSQAQSARDLLREPAAAAVAAGGVDALEAFRQRLQGREWEVPGVRGLTRVRFEGQNLRALDAGGNGAVGLPTEVVWPGLLRITGNDGEVFMMVVSQDLERLLVAPVRGQFRGLAAR